MENTEVSCMSNKPKVTPGLLVGMLMLQIRQLKYCLLYERSSYRELPNKIGILPIASKSKGSFKMLSKIFEKYWPATRNFTKK